MKTYKCRIEAWRDAAVILTAIVGNSAESLLKYSVEPEQEIPELTVTITTNLEPTVLYQLIQAQEDCHVAAESLKLATEFDGVRDAVYAPTNWREASQQQRENRLFRL